MKRRNFLVGAGAAAIGGSALLGSGAFSEVNAQRQVTVQVAEDPNAYLGMDDCQDSNGNTTPNSSFASIDDDGHLQVDMTPSNPGRRRAGRRCQLGVDNLVRQRLPDLQSGKGGRLSVD
jgi:hypothetical protein